MPKGLYTLLLPRFQSHINFRKNIYSHLPNKRACPPIYLLWQCFGILWDTLGMLWNTSLRFRDPFQPCMYVLILRKNSPCTVLFWSARLLILRKSAPLHIYSILHVYWYWWTRINCILHSTYKYGWKGSLNLIEVFQSIPKVSQSIPKHCQSNPMAIPKQYQSILINFEKKKSPLHGLILVCTFIDFEKKFFPARLFHPARLLLLACGYFGIL